MSDEEKPCINEQCEYYDKSADLNCGGECGGEPAIALCKKSQWKEKLMDREIGILQHSLGLTDPCAGGKMYRNYYAAEGKEPQLEALVEKGLMIRGRTYNEGTGQYYHVTEEGKKVAAANMPKPPSLAKRRYRRFLDTKDAFPDLEFKEFLAGEHWKDARGNP